MTLKGHSSHSVHIVSSLHCFFSSARALLLAPPTPASRPSTSHGLAGAPLSFPPFHQDREGGPSRAAHQSKCPEKPLPPQVPPHAIVRQSCSAPFPPGRPIAGGLGRRRPAPPALSSGSAGGRSGPRHSLVASGAQVAALLSAGCWAEAAGATGRPEGRLSFARARGTGPRTEEEAAALSLPGSQCPPGRVAAGRSRPGVSLTRLRVRLPELPAALWGCLQSPQTHLRRPPGTQVRGRVRSEGATPAASGAGAGPSAALDLTGPPAALSLTGYPPRLVARRELPEDRSSGCCPLARPLARRPPPLPLSPGPCPVVYMPVKLPATPSPSEPRLPEGEASRPATWTGHLDLGPPDPDPRALCCLRHHLGGIQLWCFEEGVWCRERNPGDFWLSPFLGLRGFRLRELAHGFLDEEEEIQIPNHFHPGGADCGPLRERGPLLQSPTAGWRGFCQLIFKVGAGAVAPAGKRDDERYLAIWLVWRCPWGLRVLRIMCVWGRFARGRAERSGRSGPEEAGRVPGTPLRVTCQIPGGLFFRPTSWGPACSLPSAYSADFHKEHSGVCDLRS